MHTKQPKDQKVFFIIFITEEPSMAKLLGLSIGDPNLRVLTAPQQPTPGKFKVLLVVGFKPGPCTTY